MQLLLATMVICLLLRQGQSQAVGKGTEDVWVDGRLGGKVELGCEEEEGGGCPPHCLWNGPQGAFCLFDFKNNKISSISKNKTVGKVFFASLRWGRRRLSALGASSSLTPTGR